MLHWLQTFTQKAFLALEKLFNVIFGDCLNPLYYLGAISYFFLWIALGTGLYLYAFFETGVNVAYASVQALTLDQWFAGGIVRSVHRYASDALVFTMLLHMLRHFTFGRYRGFRWFSWVSGVMLLWLTFASGINGYMLPWDRVAQYIVTTTTEWFDVLPVIGGSMARNFITNANVSDRVFSLLAFLHIGIPLSVLALLWVHTQRVPGARTNPPRGLMVSLTGMLLVLAILWPAHSQAPVDMGTLPVAITFDWFYLPVYALINSAGPLVTWLVCIGATALLVILPWIGRGAGNTQLATWTMAVHPDERMISGRAGETLLDAGLRSGLPMPFDCRNGGCGVCKARIIHGSVRLGPYQEAVLTVAERAQGQTLLCCAEPLGDIEIEYVPVEGTVAQTVRVYRALVAEMVLLSTDVMRLRLELPGDEPLEFRAGQYVNILLDNGEKRSFSFASSPHFGGSIELQVRLVPGGRFTTAVFETMRVGDYLRFEGPLGTFSLREDSDKPIVFVAGFTGFAPVKSMVEWAFYSGIRRQIFLYWGVRRPEDLYLSDLPQQWARDHANFHYVPVVSEPMPQDDWEGRTGLVHEAIIADFADLSSHQIYACGSAKMIAVAQPAFVQHGIATEDCFSDVFHLAPQRTHEGETADLVKLGGNRE